MRYSVLIKALTLGKQFKMIWCPYGIIIQNKFIVYKWQYKDALIFKDIYSELLIKEESI